MARLREEGLIPCGLQREGVRAEGMISLNELMAGGMLAARGCPRLERGGRRLLSMVILLAAPSRIPIVLQKGPVFA